MGRIGFLTKDDYCCLKSYQSSGCHGIYVMMSLCISIEPASSAKVKLTRVLPINK